MLRQTLQGVVNKYDQHELAVSHLSNITILDRRFKLRDFSKKNKQEVWKSPSMYTHVCGYKFYLMMIPNWGFSNDTSIRLAVLSLRGEFDDTLRWPAKIKITVELINRHRGDNFSDIFETTLINRSRWMMFSYSVFISHSKLDPFLKNDSLHFNVPHVEFL